MHMLLAWEHVGGHVLGDAKDATRGALHKANCRAPGEELHVLPGPQAGVHCMRKHLEAAAFQGAGDFQRLFHIDVALEQAGTRRENIRGADVTEHWVPYQEMGQQKPGPYLHR